MESLSKNNEDEEDVLLLFLLLLLVVVGRGWAPLKQAEWLPDASPLVVLVLLSHSTSQSVLAYKHPP
jgi:hypothetical protein